VRENRQPIFDTILTRESLRWRTIIKDELKSNQEIYPLIISLLLRGKISSGAPFELVCLEGKVQRVVLSEHVGDVNFVEVVRVSLQSLDDVFHQMRPSHLALPAFRGPSWMEWSSLCPLSRGDDALGIGIDGAIVNVKVIKRREVMDKDSELIPLPFDRDVSHNQVSEKLRAVGHSYRSRPYIRWISLEPASSNSCNSGISSLLRSLIVCRSVLFTRASP